MWLELAPFEERHVPGAAALLAVRHRRDRALAAQLPERFEHPAGAQEAIEALCAGGQSLGAVAVRDRRVAGYLLGTVRAEPDALFGVEVPLAGHAVDPAVGPAIYAELYAAAAPRWLAAGCFAHAVLLPATDGAAIDAWAALGFGFGNVRAVSRLGAHEQVAAPAGITVRQAGPDDIDVVMSFRDKVARHHVAPPVLEPFLATPEFIARARERQIGRLGEPDHAVWLAERDGATLAGVILTPADDDEMDVPPRSVSLDQAFTEPAARGGGVARTLLSRAMSWASEQGYEWCVLNWASANYLAARFWPRVGFRPQSYWLTRRIDPRVTGHSGTP